MRLLELGRIDRFDGLCGMRRDGSEIGSTAADQQGQVVKT